MRVSASSVISSVAETSATPARCRRDGEFIRESVPFGVRTFGWRSALQPAFVAASVGWAGLLLLAPLVASRPHASQAGTALVLAVYGVGSLLCHQLPDRSYRVW